MYLVMNNRSLGKYYVIFNWVNFFRPPVESAWYEVHVKAFSTDGDGGVTEQMIHTLPPNPNTTIPPSNAWSIYQVSTTHAFGLSHSHLYSFLTGHKFTASFMSFSASVMQSMTDFTSNTVYTKYSDIH